MCIFHKKLTKYHILLLDILEIILILNLLKASENYNYSPKLDQSLSFQKKNIFL